MSVACDPFVESGSYPEAVDTASDDDEKEPLDPGSKETSACTCEGESSAVNDDVADNELIDIADRPGGCNSASEHDDETCYDGIYDGVENAAVPIGSGLRHYGLLIYLLRLGLGLRCACGNLLGSARRAELKIIFYLFTAIAAKMHSVYSLKSNWYV